MTPIIGVTATLKEDVDTVAERPLGRYVRADLDYVEGVAAAGGVPVVLPPVGDARTAEAVIRGLDGLLLSGGSDLDPGYYGEMPSPNLGPTIPERDAFEVALLEAALRCGVPVFGICRGLQVLNVACGGTLHQHLPDRTGRDVHGDPTDGVSLMHPVTVAAGSKLEAAVRGASLDRCTSHHHQGVDRVGKGLVAVAWSPDGLVEALEPVTNVDHSGWVLGVQWHPEATAAEDPAQQAIFDAFAEQVRLRAQGVHVPV